MGGTNPIRRGPTPNRVATGGIIRMSNITLLIFAFIFSLLFIVALSCSFFGADEDEPYFKSILNEVAQSSPGIVLLGENVDVDVDEPSVTISWMMVGCGDGYVLDDSYGIHDSSSCGLPSMSLQIYVDSSSEPAATYDPSQLPIVRQTGRRNKQDLVQFDSDHPLDSHEERLYPFDTYGLSSTLRAVDASNNTVPIRRLATIDQVAKFLVASIDVDSYEGTSNGQLSSRDIYLRIRRPWQARVFALLLFGLSWMLTHITFGQVFLARKHKGVKPIILHLVSAFAVVLAIPQLRMAMPDGPDLDDCVGYFPQMILSTFSVLILLLLIILREFNDMDDKAVSVTEAPAVVPSTPSAAPSDRPSPLKPLILGTKRRTISVSIERGDFEKEKHGINNAFVFPPRPLGCTIHHRSRSSQSTLAFGGRPGSVYGYSLSRSSTLRTVKER
ncbi:hypothetical protein F5I97DRAFT_1810227 [Phlebopus sp. FC_14]|nr:hypothetical protein F5I97DRAFT_1810227 [Phlebopus sp. FC_14]